MWELIKAVAPAAVTVVLTAYVGSKIAQHWQLRSWILQQKITDRDQKYTELKSLYDDLDRIVNRRLYRLRTLIWALKREDKAVVEDKISAYAEIVAEWNEKLNSLFVRFVRNLSSGSFLFWRFEQEVSNPLIETGAVAEKATRAFRTGGKTGVSNSSWAQYEARLDLANHRLIEIMRDLYVELQKLKDGRFTIAEEVGELRGELTDLSKVSSIRLIQAIFQPRN